MRMVELFSMAGPFFLDENENPHSLGQRLGVQLN